MSMDELILSILKKEVPKLKSRSVYISHGSKSWSRPSASAGTGTHRSWRPVTESADTCETLHKKLKNI